MIQIALTHLSEVAKCRDHLTTSEFARTFNRADQTVRKNYCLQGHCFGIRPTKIGNRLMWPVASVAAILNGGAA